MNFVTIDFETATAQRDSPCEIGLTFVEDSKIIETKSWLIKPHYEQFDYFNILVHGIHPIHVANEPSFGVLWDTIAPLIEGKFLIAHNAGFDFSVLRRSLEYYSKPFPNVDYSCSYIFSKKVWTGLPAYDLKSLCKANGINFSHHRAGEDSRATAELCLKAFEISGVSSALDFPEKLKTSIGQLYIGGYKPSETRRERIYRPRPKLEFEINPELNNPASIFYEKKVVFTGALLSMVRGVAMQKIVDIGGYPANDLTRDTDFLVVGYQDYRIVGEEGMSNKQTKAISMIEKGAELEILSEDDFLKNL